MDVGLDGEPIRRDGNQRLDGAPSLRPDLKEEGVSEAGLHGGEVWEQKRFPFFRCYLVYLGKDGWCRIQPPDERGNIAWATETDKPGKWQYTTDEMVALLDEHRYVLVGQFADILKKDQETNWELAVESASG